MKAPIAAQRGVLLASLLLACGFIAQAQTQPPIELTETGADQWEATWNGVALRTYFLQQSFDFITWDYAPVVRFGAGAQEANVSLEGAAKTYLRLVYVDNAGATTLQQARDMDFDGDMIPNAFEVEELESDPLDGESAGGDSDADGLPDGWELYFFGNLALGPTDDPDSDGQANSLELANKTNPAEVLNPALSPRGINSPAALQVTVTCPTPGAEIHYTLNGAEPTKFDPLIASGGKLDVPGNLTVKAKAWLAASPSFTTTEEYRITGDVSGGAFHALSMSGGGTVWSWGLQTHGRLGNGLTTAVNVTSPIAARYEGNPFPAVVDGARVAAGDTHSVILSASGKVWAFGDNSDGALGTLTSTPAYATPVLKGVLGMSNLENCIAVGAGLSFSTALAADHTVYAWGLKGAGRLGDGSTSGSRNYADPVTKEGGTALTGIDGIATGHAFGLAREPHAFDAAGGTGKVWAWGHNASGQLGVGDSNNRTRATLMLYNGAPITDVLDMSAGENHAAVVRWKTGEANLQGSVWCVGERANGRLGNNVGTSLNVTNPVQVLKLTDLTPLYGVTSVACGSAHTLALDVNGEVWAWGYNGFGALGDNTTDNRFAAVKVRDPLNPSSALSNIVRIGAGGDGNGNFSMAIAADGKVYTWGRNANGQLGNGTLSGAVLPTLVPGLSFRSHMPTLALTFAINESAAPGMVTVTAHPGHSAPQGVSLIERVDLFLNGVSVGSCFAPNWTATLSSLPVKNYHLYGIARDFSGKVAMSPPLQFQIGTALGGGPGDDPDGDGLTNAEEALLGTDPNSASFSGHAGTEQYQYDVLDRVTGVTGARSHTFQYDEAGNVKKAE